MVSNSLTRKQYAGVLLTAALSSILTSGLLNQQPQLVLAQKINAATEIRNLPYTDIRRYGAKCDGTDQWSKVATGITAGVSRFFIPAGCTIIPPTVSGHPTIPANLYIEGENWLTSIITGSIANPASTQVWIGAKSQIHNINVKQFSNQLSSNASLVAYINTSDSAVEISTTGWGAWHVVGNPGGGIDTTPVFFRTVAGLGDAMNSTTFNPNGQAARFDTDGGDSDDLVPGGFGAVLIGRRNNGFGLQITDFNNTGTGDSARGDSIDIVSTRRTTGYFLYGQHSTSAYSNAAIFLDMAKGSGSFTGPAMTFYNNNVEKFTVSSNGVLTMPALASLSGTRYICINTAGLISSSTTACSGT